MYKATEVYMVQDKSEDFCDTWHFLDRRIEDLTSFGKAARNVCPTMARFLNLKYSSKV